jgi:dolichol-phosphate mannosyltransferase
VRLNERKTAVVIPALNEESAIVRVVRGSRRVRGVARVIVVDDGSSDRTGTAARRAGAAVIRHAANRGVGAALRDGYQLAARLGCGTIVTMGGDDQDRAVEIVRLLRGLDSGNDFVQGSRWIRGGRVVNIPLFRRLTTIAYSLIFSVLAGRRITDGTNGFRAFRTCILRGMSLNQRWLDTYELEPYIFWNALKNGCRVAEIPVTKKYPKSGTGYTKMKPFRDWWRIFRPLILLALRIRK